MIYRWEDRIHENAYIFGDVDNDECIHDQHYEFSPSCFGVNISISYSNGWIDNEEATHVSSNNNTNKRWNEVHTHKSWNLVLLPLQSIRDILMFGKDLLNQSIQNKPKMLWIFEFLNEWTWYRLTCKEKEKNKTLQKEEGNVVMEGILEMDNITTLEHSNKADYTEWVKDRTNRLVLDWKDIDSKDRQLDNPCSYIIV